METTYKTFCEDAANCEAGKGIRIRDKLDKKFASKAVREDLGMILDCGILSVFVMDDAKRFQHSAAPRREAIEGTHHGSGS